MLDIIESGYKIPFIQTPTSYYANNNASARNHFDFVSEAVNELLGQRCIEEITEKPFIINPLTVTVQSSGKKRLILDLRHVNKFIYKQKFKCEDVKTAIQLLDKDFFLFKFAWNFGQSKTRYFRFCALPFGLSTAPFVFTKLLKALIKSWRSQGIPIVVFLDDGLGGGPTQRQAKTQSLTVLSVHADLLKCGFLVNEDKRQWTPRQETIWLGYVIYTLTNYIRATDKRVQKLLSSIEELTRRQPTSGMVHVKNLVSVVGQIISFELTAGTTVRVIPCQFIQKKLKMTPYLFNSF